MLDSYAETVRQSTSIPSLFLKCCHSAPQGKSYEFPEHTADSGIIWHSCTRQETLARILAIAQSLTAAGVTKGQSVAIMSGTRPEWMEIDLAILLIGAVCVSIYPSLPAHDVGFILFDSEAKVVFAENQEQLDKLIWLEENEIIIPARDNDAPQEHVHLSFSKIYTIEVTTDHSKKQVLQNVFLHSLDEKAKDELIALSAAIDRSTVASIVYTSGTTGAPKGVVQTHGNHLANVEQAVKSGVFAMDGDLFLFLPLAHSFARLIGYLGMLTPASLKFCGVADKKSSKVDLFAVSREIVSANANVLPTVPRIFEKKR